MFGTAIGRLKIIIGGDGSDLDMMLAGAGKKIGAFASSVAKVGTAGLVVGVTAAALALVHLTHSSLETIDAQSKLAYRLKGTTEDIQTLAYAADLAGVSQEQLAKSAFKMGQGLAEAARTGSGPAYEALRRLGLSASDLLKLDVSERLAVISDRMQELGYTTAQQADVLKAFGVRGQELISLFEGGGESIRQARNDVRAFGVAVSDIDAVKVEQANDAWTTARLIITGIGNQLAVTLAPLIKHVAERFADAVRESGGFGELIQSVVRRAIVAIGYLPTAIYDIRFAWASFIKFFDVSMTDTVLNGMRLAAMFMTGKWIPPLTKVRDTAAEVRQELGERPDPEAWGTWFDEISRKAAESAKKVSDERKKMLGTEGPKTDPLTEEQRKQQQEKFLDFQRSLATEDAALTIHRDQQLAKLAEFQAKEIGTAAEHAAAKLAIEEKYRTDLNNLVFAKLEEGVATEQELLLRKHEQQLAAIAEFENNRTITENAAAELRRKYAEKAALDLKMIQARQYSQLAGVVDTAMGHIREVVGDQGGAAFEVMKGISMATALVKGYETVLSAYAAGMSVGGPAAPAVAATFAAVAAAGVAAQIASIAATRPGSGGGGAPAPMPAGGGAASEAAGAGGGGSAGGTQTLLVQGIDPSSIFSGDAVRMLAGRLLEFQRDGGKVVLA
jgi:hypothetical protein